jgi:DNA-binding PadR family transcriptional regulator
MPIYRDISANLSLNPVASLRESIRRGSARLLILNTLSARPMHGYEISKEISASFDGLYEPSPGVIYPTLQWLEDQEYVSGTRENGKTVYKITGKGRAFLNQNQDNLSQVNHFIRNRSNSDELPILKSAVRLQRLITLYLPEMSREKRIKVAKILDEATNRIAKLNES